MIQSKEKNNDSITKISTQKKHSDKMKKNLKSGKIVHCPDETGCENVVEDVHEKSSRSCACALERR